MARLSVPEWLVLMLNDRYADKTAIHLGTNRMICAAPLSLKAGSHRRATQMNRTDRTVQFRSQVAVQRVERRTRRRHGGKDGIRQITQAPTRRAEGGEVCSVKQCISFLVSRTVIHSDKKKSLTTVALFYPKNGTAN